MDIAKMNSLVFIRDFIAEGKDQNIPLSETYLFYGEYVKENFRKIWCYLPKHIVELRVTIFTRNLQLKTIRPYR